LLELPPITPPHSYSISNLYFLFPAAQKPVPLVPNKKLSNMHHNAKEKRKDVSAGGLNTFFFLSKTTLQLTAGFCIYCNRLEFSVSTLH
jgi:hypothetical protein